MAIDLAALRLKLATQSAATKENKDGTDSNSTGLAASNSSVPVSSTNINNASSTSMGTGEISGASNNIPDTPAINPPAKLGTSKTSEIDHLDFLSKLNSLADAIHKQHPTMPVLLQQIHKQLRTDEELVTTLDEDAIGVIVKGLQIQTKTELVAEAVAKTGTRKKKNAALSTDMF